jgi:hypothetical protein
MGELAVPRRLLREDTGVPCRSLAEYVRELLARLEAADRRALARIGKIVQGHSARLVLEDEVAIVRFRSGRPVVIARNSARGKSGTRVIDGEGSTSRRTTLRLLDGYVEVSEAVVLGELELTGTIDGVTRMGMAIEIVLDVAARAPALQALARDFRDDPCRPAERELWRTPRPNMPLTSSSDAELALLSRLGLTSR